MVNVSDEALVMQVVKYYFPRWDKLEDMVEEDDGTGGGGVGKQVCGPKRGERNTGSRTIKHSTNMLQSLRVQEPLNSGLFGTISCKRKRTHNIFC